MRAGVKQKAVGDRDRYDLLKLVDFRFTQIVTVLCERTGSQVQLVVEGGKTEWLWRRNA